VGLEGFEPSTRRL